MSDYLPDATDFTDMPTLPKPGERFSNMHDHDVQCPLCKGHGGWNLRLDAYHGPCTCGHVVGRHLHTNVGQVTRCYDCGCASYVSSRTPEQRHFRAFCRQCWGWGWVRPGVDAEHVHAFVEVAPDQPWRGWHTVKCTTCGATRSYDSSD